VTDPRPLRVGDLIRDNDPLYRGKRVLVVLRVVSSGTAEYAIAAPIRRETRIRLDRIHTDGRPRRSGWSLVT